LEGIYGRNKEFLEFPNSLDGLGLSKRKGLIKRKDYLMTSFWFLPNPNPNALARLTKNSPVWVATI
jgi:hypothetical protein